MSEGSGGNSQNDLLDLTYDPSTGSCLPPPLRPPSLSQAQLLAAIELGFSDKYLPAGVPGALGNGGGNSYYSSNNSSEYGSTFSSGDYIQQGNPQQQQQQFSQGEFIEGRQGQFTGRKEDQGLLPGLRRPHINEIPPDVLAVLLKTASFQEILGSLQRQQGDNPTMSDFNYGPGSSADQSRMPARNPSNHMSNSQQQSQNSDRNYAGTPPQHNQRNPNTDRNYAGTPPQHNQRTSTGTLNSDRNYAGTPPQHNQRTPNSDRNYSGTPSQHNQRTPTGTPNSAPLQRFNSPPQSQTGPKGRGREITLSPMAKEFHPSMPPTQQQTMANMGAMNSQEEAELAQAVAQIQNFQMQGQSPANQGDYDSNSFSNQMTSEDNSDLILTTVTDAITDLTLYPANFKRCTKSVTVVLKKYLQDVDTLGIVVTLLVEQSISNANFCYSGARLSHVLHKNGIAVGNATFKNVFLGRLQEEFNLCVANMKDPEILARCRGLLMYFGELFVNFRIDSAAAKRQPITVLGLGVLELMQKLVKDPSHENVKSVFQVLKLVGWELENSQDAKIKPEFEQLMKDLSYICMAVSNIKPQTKLLLDTLFELKNKKWNREEERPQTPSGSSSSSNISGTPSSNFYELPESDEDDFDESGLMLDDEPEEVQQAYEEFLMRMSKK